MNLLEQLLGKNFGSQVGSAFRRKRFNRIGTSEFTPGLRDQEMYDKYLANLGSGLMLTEEGYDYYTSPKEHATPGYTLSSPYGPSTYVEGKEGDWDEVWGSLDPISDSFSQYWVDPSEDDPINIFDPQSLMAGFERAGMEGVTKDMFTPFKASDIRGIVPSYYTGELEAARGNLATDLSSNIARAAGLGAGFAGYGGREVAKERAKDVYETGVENVYANIDEARALAAQNLYSKLEDYSNLISQATTT